MLLDSSVLLKPWKSWRDINDNLHFAFTCLVALTLPIDVDVQFCSIATVLLLLNWLAGGNFKTKLRVVWQQKAGLLLLGFYLLHVIGLLYSEDLKHGGFDLEKKLSLFILPLILLSKPLSIHQRDYVVVVFVVFAIWLSLVGIWYGLWHYEEMIHSKGPEHLVTYIANMHRVYFSIYLLFCFLAIFYYYRKFELGNKPILKWLSLFLALVLGLILFVMASRIAIIILIVSASSLVFYFMVIKRKQYVKALIVALLGLAALAFVYMQVTYIRTFMNQLTEQLDQGQTENVNSVNIRLVKYKCALQGIKDNWMFGVGTGDVQNTLNAIYLENGFEEGYKVNMDAHNQYLQTWLGLGVPGISLFILLIGASLWRGVRERNYLFIYLILLFAVCCLSESLLTTQKGIVFLALFYPLVYYNHENSISSD